MNTTIKTLVAATLVASVGVASAAGSASLSATGYSENFDSMGASANIANGWSVFVGASGTDKYTWQSEISAAGVASMVAASSSLSVRSSNFSSSSTNNPGYNAFLPGNTSDRLLATSPTGIAGTALQLTLQNDSNHGFSRLAVSYDIQRFRTVASVEELPGYGVFYSLNGSTWNDVATLTPTASQMPYDTTGFTTMSGTIDLGTTVGAGSTVYLRWIDDNGIATSPDQAIGLNNVSIAAVPEPETFALMLAGLGLIGFAARRRRA